MRKAFNRQKTINKTASYLDRLESSKKVGTGTVFGTIPIGFWVMNTFSSPKAVAATISILVSQFAGLKLLKKSIKSENELAARLLGSRKLCLTLSKKVKNKNASFFLFMIAKANLNETERDCLKKQFNGTATVAENNRASRAMARETRRLAENGELGVHATLFEIRKVMKKKFK
ncbi:MAG: hypothetical protein WC821_01070 [archaeon]|jgi:hypothetical protein